MKLIDFFPSWMTGGGIFSKLDGMPWDNDESVFKLGLDIEYFGNRSGNRESSALLDKMTAPDNFNPLTEMDIARLKINIKSKFLKEWQRLWDLRNAEYEPLENYNMVEKGNEDNTDRYLDNYNGSSHEGHNENIEYDHRNDNTEKIDSDVETETKRASDITRQTDNVVYGLGSVDGKRSSTVIENEIGEPDNNNEITTVKGEGDKNKKVVEDITKDTTKRSADDNYIDRTDGHLLNHDGSSKHNHDLTRRGNIGVTTTQQMAEQEINLWKWHYFDTVMDDLDTILTCPYWGLK